MDYAGKAGCGLILIHPIGDCHYDPRGTEFFDLTSDFARVLRESTSQSTTKPLCNGLNRESILQKKNASFGCEGHKPSEAPMNRSLSNRGGLTQQNLTQRNGVLQRLQHACH
ncbi:hypothetical protein Rcae01_01112 [Novipirellula caenicola]|uniref:Uncharacterized protein n=1 Tax=Novipirellula caenicola TaxID=1536901 RepID=A0ABP9VKG9_9BACT